MLLGASSNKLFIGSLFLVIILSCSEKKIYYNFSDHVAPIIFSNCSSCHYKKGPAPFSMMKYSDVAKRAKMVAYVTKSGYMPPWPADANYSHFIGEKILSEDEKMILQEWYNQGCVAGDTSKLTSPLVLSKTKRNIGNPDLVLKMNNAFIIPGNNKDLFMVTKLPFELDSDTNIRLIEFVPDNKQLVHHLNAHLITYDNEKNSHLLDVKPIVNGDIHNDSTAFHQLNIPYEDGTFPKLQPSVSNYLPGVEALLYPDGIGGLRVNKQSALLIKDIHYGPTPIIQTDHSYFNIYFDKNPPTRQIGEFILGTQGISPVIPPLVIPPNQVKKFETETIIPEDISVLTINPHMHLIGKEFKAYAISPIGDSIPLIKIDNWNFRWQYFYTFPKMLHLPAGSLIKVEAIFDNTLNNLDNPHNPPEFVSGKTGSMKTTDEMLQFVVMFLPYQEGDEKISLE
tara:strand:- start:1211 stop:2569 length:1359 start_codon:yes stop_codon:yes gene_type:complete